MLILMHIPFQMKVVINLLRSTADKKKANKIKTEPDKPGSTRKNCYFFNFGHDLGNAEKHPDSRPCQ